MLDSVVLDNVVQDCVVHLMSKCPYLLIRRSIEPILIGPLHAELIVKSGLLYVFMIIVYHTTPQQIITLNHLL